VVFFNEESVKLLTNDPQISKLGVEMLACYTTCNYLGIKVGDLISGARMTSMAEIVVMMEEKDRTLFLG
jgi:peroxiredoxin family protein